MHCPLHLDLQLGHRWRQMWCNKSLHRSTSIYDTSPNTPSKTCNRSAIHDPMPNSKSQVSNVLNIYKPAVSLSAAQRPKPIAWLDIENRVDTHSAIDRWVFLGQHLLYGSLIYDFGYLASADCVYGLLHYLYYRKIITSLGRGPSALRLGQGRCQVAQYLIGGNSNNKSLSYARLDVWHKLLTACWYWFNSIYTANMSIAFQVIFQIYLLANQNQRVCKWYLIIKHTHTKKSQVAAMWAHAAWARVANFYEYRFEVVLAVVPIIQTISHSTRF